MVIELRFFKKKKKDEVEHGQNAESTFSDIIHILNYKTTTFCILVILTHSTP